MMRLYSIIIQGKTLHNAIDSICMQIFYKFINNGYLGNVGRFGEKNREGMLEIKKINLGEFLGNLCQSLTAQREILHGTSPGKLFSAQH